MSEKKEKKDAEELREVLSVVSKEVPGLLKGLIASVFSEEAGRDMGKAAGAFYKGLKEAGIPEETAVKMTENYVSSFTSLGDLMKGRMKGGEIGKKIESVKEKTAEKEEQ